MNQAAFKQELKTELSAIAADCGCELAHAEFSGNTLRVILDRPEGSVSISDCQTVSKQISSLLDVHDFAKERYLLEVSSPGLDRELYGPKDYERFQGHLIRVTYFCGEPSQKKTVIGRLDSFSPTGEGQITVVESSQEDRLEIPLPQIKVARLEIEL